MTMCTEIPPGPSGVQASLGNAGKTGGDSMDPYENEEYTTPHRERKNNRFKHLTQA